jgi:hypothetical protein
LPAKIKKAAIKKEKKKKSKNVLKLVTTQQRQKKYSRKMKPFFLSEFFNFFCLEVRQNFHTISSKPQHLKVTTKPKKKE